jgi:hypothetical protein
MVLLVDQQTVLAFGQQVTVDRYSDPVPSGQQIDPVVGAFNECRRFHSALL